MLRGVQDCRPVCCPFVFYPHSFWLLAYTGLSAQPFLVLLPSRLTYWRSSDGSAVYGQALLPQTF
jgi:hypothetical protein